MKSAKIHINMDQALKDEMDKHKEINWSDVARQAFRLKLSSIESDRHVNLLRKQEANPQPVIMG